MEVVVEADGMVEICIAGGEIIGEVPAQQKNLHFCIGGSLSLLHCKLMSDLSKLSLVGYPPQRNFDLCCHSRCL
jgi:hypothetical protein